MTILDDARAAGAIIAAEVKDGDIYDAIMNDRDLTAFAERIRADEREKNAAICERLAAVLSGPNESDGEYAPMMLCAAAIRNHSPDAGKMAIKQERAETGSL